MKLIKIITASSLLVASLFAADTVDDNVLKFEKQRFSKNQRIQIKDVKVNLKKRDASKRLVWIYYRLRCKNGRK